MKLAIMQPYFMPYIGYFQLMNAVDEFVIYDDIQFTKKGWINRNRICLNGKSNLFSIPLKKDSDYLNLNERFLAADADFTIQRTLRQIKNAYLKAPHFKEVFPLIELIFLCEQKNLFEYILASLIRIKDYLDIKCKLVISSGLAMTPGLKGQDKVLAICKELKASQYINLAGGIDLYDKDIFKSNFIDLKFHEMNRIEYETFESFVPSLSIIDVLMFNSKEEKKNLLSEFQLT